MLFVLLARFVFVTLVRETITCSRKHKFNLFPHHGGLSLLKWLFVNERPLKVNRLCVSLFLLLAPYAFGEAMEETFFISKGEHIELSLAPESSFSVGGPDVVSYKLISQKNKLLLKGKKIGVSEVIIWEKGGEKKSYFLYIISKNRQLKLMQLIDLLKPLNLKVSLKGPGIVVEGYVQSLEHLTLLEKLKQKYPKDIYVLAKLTKKLKRHLLAEITELLLSYNISNFHCSPSKLTFHCEIQHNDFPSKLRKIIEENYHCPLYLMPSPLNNENYLIETKIHQFQRSDGEEFNLGSSSLMGQLSDLLQAGKHINLYENNSFKMGEENYLLKTLGHPQVVTQLNQKASFSVGQERPYQEKSKDDIITKWKFHGLKILLNLKRQGLRYLLRYKTSLSQGGHNENGEISQSSQKSSLHLELNKEYLLFDLGIWGETEHEESLFLLSKIPLVGSLFRSSSKSNSFRRIIATVTIRKIQ